MFFLKLFLIIISVFLIWHFSTKKMINPYKLVFIMGKKGSGKSTFMTKIRIKTLRRGGVVYTNAKDIPNCIYFEPSDIGHIPFPEGSTILIDECSLVWPNRNWKNTKPETIQWFRYQRQYRCKVYLFSQTFDVDSKIRDLSDSMYLVTPFLRAWSVARAIDKKIVIQHGNRDSPSTIAEDFDFRPFFRSGAFRFTFIPRWSRYFKSFNPPQIPPYFKFNVNYTDNIHENYFIYVIRRFKRFLIDIGFKVKQKFNDEE